MYSSGQEIVPAEDRLEYSRRRTVQAKGVLLKNVKI